MCRCARETMPIPAYLCAHWLRRARGPMLRYRPIAQCGMWMRWSSVRRITFTAPMRGEAGVCPPPLSWAGLCAVLAVVLAVVLLVWLLCVPPPLLSPLLVLLLLPLAVWSPPSPSS